MEKLKPGNHVTFYLNGESIGDDTVIEIYRSLSVDGEEDVSFDVTEAILLRKDILLINGKWGVRLQIENAATKAAQS
jgi:hypothetical protein